METATVREQLQALKQEAAGLARRRREIEREALGLIVGLADAALVSSVNMRDLVTLARDLTEIPEGDAL